MVHISLDITGWAGLQEVPAERLSLLRQGLALCWGKKQKEINGLRLKRERMERKKERDEDKGVERYRRDKTGKENLEFTPRDNDYLPTLP